MHGIALILDRECDAAYAFPEVLSCHDALYTISCFVFLLVLVEMHIAHWWSQPLSCCEAH